jgi:hypothetical protein
MVNDRKAAGQVKPYSQKSCDIVPLMFAGLSQKRDPKLSKTLIAFNFGNKKKSQICVN